MKRFLSGLLTLTIIVSCFSTSVLAESNKVVDSKNEEKQIIAQKEDFVSEMVKQKGLFEKEKIQEFF